MSLLLKHSILSLVRTALISILILSGYSASFAQDYGWWNTLVQWDGKSHWSEYFIYTPKFFGPNAIPVPQIKNGLLINQSEIDIGLAAHFSNGDDTQNLTSRVFIPITKNRIGLQIHAVPYERYQMTAETRDERRARDFDGKGFAFGDLYIGTWIQLTKPDAKMDILLTINLKTASGSNREATRYTDGSGYNFDLSFGKSYMLNGETNYIRPHAQIGFYVWETNEDRNPQNDAFSFGVGAEFKKGKTLISSQIGGYIGYKGNGDKPVIVRTNLTKILSEQIDLLLGTQFGLGDFPYNSVFLSVIKKW